MAKQAGSNSTGAVFVVLGLAFIAIGAARQRAFVAVGIAFLVIGAVRMARSRRS